MAPGAEAEVEKVTAIGKTPLGVRPSLCRFRPTGAKPRGPTEERNTARCPEGSVTIRQRPATFSHASVRVHQTCEHHRLVRTVRTTCLVVAGTAVAKSGATYAVRRAAGAVASAPAGATTVMSDAAVTTAAVRTDDRRVRVLTRTLSGHPGRTMSGAPHLAPSARAGDHSRPVRSGHRRLLPLARGCARAGLRLALRAGRDPALGLPRRGHAESRGAGRPHRARGHRRGRARRVARPSGRGPVRRVRRLPAGHRQAVPAVLRPVAVPTVVRPLPRRDPARTGAPLEARGRDRGRQRGGRGPGAADAPVALRPRGR